MCSLVCVVQSLHILMNPSVYGLPHDSPGIDDAVGELLQETRLLASLRHSNIVQLRGIVMEPDDMWLVTEFANGGSLEAWLAKHDAGVTLAELLNLFMSVMRALVYLHSRTPAVVHRDVKPANLLVFETFGGGVLWKLGDVGIAKVLQSSARARTQAGTPMYMAMDVLAGPYDGKVDVFSLGIMTAELIVQHMDVPGFDRCPTTLFRYPEQRLALVDEACRRMDCVCPTLSSLLRRCCAMKAKNRVDSATALKELEVIAVQFEVDRRRIRMDASREDAKVQ
jgi:serine/threonine protein kinase